jgi:hypothetical protein
LRGSLPLSVLIGRIRFGNWRSRTSPLRLGSAQLSSGYVNYSAPLNHAPVYASDSSRRDASDPAGWESLTRPRQVNLRGEIPWKALWARGAPPPDGRVGTPAWPTGAGGGAGWWRGEHRRRRRVGAGSEGRNVTPPAVALAGKPHVEINTA